MRNILLEYLKTRDHYTDETLSSTLGISQEQYEEIMTGDRLMTRKQAQKLGRLFKVEPKYIYDSAVLLDEYRTKETVLKITKNSLSHVLQRIQDLIEKYSQPVIEQ